MRLIETFFYSLEGVPLLWASLTLVNQCEPAGPSPHLARGYVLAGLLAGIVRAQRVAKAWCERAVEIAKQTGSTLDVGWVLARVGVLHIGVGRWDEATASATRAHEIAGEAGDLRMWEETGLECGLIDFYTGRFDRAIGRFQEAYDSTVRSGSVQSRCSAMIFRGDVLLRLGREREALALYAEAFRTLEAIDQLSDRSNWTLACCMQALARLRTGDAAGAYESAFRGLSFVASSQPVGYWLQNSSSALAEVLLSLLERHWLGSGGSHVALARQARQAVRNLRRFARRFPMGRPAALLWAGLLAWLGGHRRLALRRWQRAVDLASQLGMPYELGRAHLEIGRHLPHGTPARLRHLEDAAVIFRRLDAATDVARVQREIDGGPTVTRLAARAAS
jgi:tetratricopeptide (TPR) repeat protein